MLPVESNNSFPNVIEPIERNLIGQPKQQDLALSSLLSLSCSQWNAGRYQAVLMKMI